MADEAFVARAAELALADAHEALVQATRAWEDSNRYQDETSGAQALAAYVEAKQKYDALAGTDNKQQQNDAGQLSAATRNFLSRRVAGGDEITPARWQEYLRGHHRAIAAGFEPDTTEYFHAVAGHVDSAGDGRQPPLDEQTAAKISGISPEEYSCSTL